eukprot:136722-Pelagomonas_calceolata.AAC.3
MGKYYDKYVPCCTAGSTWAYNICTVVARSQIQVQDLTAEWELQSLVPKLYAQHVPSNSLWFLMQ